MKMTTCLRAVLAATVAVSWCALAPSSEAAQPASSEWNKALHNLRQQVMAVRKGIEEGDWYSTEPMRPNKKSRNAKVEPEVSVDLRAKIAGGKKSLWNRMNWTDGQSMEVKGTANNSIYAYRALTAKEPAKLVVEFGSADCLTVWLNQKQVLAQEKPASAREKVTLDLAKGKNELLIRISCAKETSSFFYSTGPVVSTELAKLDAKFSEENQLFTAYFSGYPRWFIDDANPGHERGVIGSMLKKLKAATTESARLDELTKNKTASSDPAWLDLFLSVARKTRALEDATALLKSVNTKALRLAIEDLAKTYPDKYKNGAAYLARLDAIEKEMPAIQKALADNDDKVIMDFGTRCDNLQREALILNNPVFDFDKILLVKRDGGRLCLPSNWQGNSSVKPATVNEIATMSIREKNAPLQRIYKPQRDVFVGDMRLHFDGERILFSSIGSNDRWQVFETKLNGSGLRQVSVGEYNDIDNYDGMYLPDGRIIFDSSSTFQGVPCVGGSDYVANLHIMDADGKNVRRLCYDQDNDWYPTMMEDGRVMYLRWEYTDSAHYFSRILMHMNPDGTAQQEFYGSNSYWPNAMFYAKPIPGKPSMFCAVVSGHHGVARAGELVLFNAAKGRQEGVGAVQRIPGYGKAVDPIIKDGLVNDSWPKFLHPFPLSDKQFLISCKPDPRANWGVYLVDVFDNMILLKEQTGQAMLEPVPLRKTAVPPVIPDRVDLSKKTATVSVQNIYAGPGLAGVPQGTVKSLRLFQYEYSYRNMGGHYFIGMEGPWDVRRIIGTVPVQPDGSAYFEIPANIPVAAQPLDAEGKALQHMRSWFVGVPGERISCTGCHEPQNYSLTLKHSEAARGTASVPTPWRGPKRGFSFAREVQPVLDRYCVGCHDGKVATQPNFADTNIVRTTSGTPLPVSYMALHPFVRRNGPEGDYHLLTPLEFHANTSELVQMLQKGHHNVKLDAEAWDRIITWIDLNVPCYGTWHEAREIPKDFEKRRYEMKKLYSNVDEDIEAIPVTYTNRLAFVPPAPEPARPASAKVAGWPFGADKAAQMQAALGNTELTLDLGGGLTMKFKRIPAGEFVMGDVNGFPDESPTTAVRVAKPFWMGVTEVSLAQYQAFNPAHKNAHYDRHYKDQVNPGYPMDDPKFPVIRVSWDGAMQFCKWLAQKTGKRVTLPSEAQWEWACRAGTDTAMNYGALDTDFSKLENLGDKTLCEMAVSGVDPKPIKNADKFWDFIPKEERFNDGTLMLADVDAFAANRWGLKNMHGNVREWTLTNFRSYPYNAGAGANDASLTGNKVVRGGSWYERPKLARSGFRLAVPNWQRPYNVGFRVIIEDQENSTVAQR
ncbi:MAG: SUMF1/EgtB/PvdO family nonheme iron enzyme [Verrucomicrobia bacterium]|nr:SUMF1/EgtB/PvdO family nonheme iron enzyme [Verrucomicrobiota bacterium]